MKMASPATGREVMVSPWHWLPRRVTVALAALLLVGPTQAGTAASAEYTLEYRRAISGGEARGGAWLDQLVVVFGDEDDWTVSFLATNDNTFGDRFSGDLQGVSNIDAGKNARIYEAWYQWTVGSVGLLAGLLDLNAEFDVIDTASLFQHASHGIGPDFSQSGARGPSIFPHPSFGVRAVGQWNQSNWRLAVFDAVPGSPQNERATSVQFHSSEGALLAGQIGSQSESASWSLGGWAYTKRAPRIDLAGQDRQAGLYAVIEHEIARFARRPVRGFLRVGTAVGDAVEIRHYVGSGLVVSDERWAWGIAIAHARLSAVARDVQPEAALAETALEITFRYQLTDRWALQPDLQWIESPGASQRRSPVVVAALRSEFTW